VIPVEEEGIGVSPSCFSPSPGDRPSSGTDALKRASSALEDEAGMKRNRACSEFISSSVRRALSTLERIRTCEKA
jgi:hypothetical protein